MRRGSLGAEGDRLGEAQSKGGTLALTADDRALAWGWRCVAIDGWRVA